MSQLFNHVSHTRQHLVPLPGLPQASTHVTFGGLAREYIALLPRICWLWRFARTVTVTCNTILPPLFSLFSLFFPPGRSPKRNAVQVTQLHLLLTLKLPFSWLRRGFPFRRFSVRIRSSSSFLSCSRRAVSSALSRFIFCSSFSSSAVSSSSLEGGRKGEGREEAEVREGGREGAEGGREGEVKG